MMNASNSNTKTFGFLSNKIPELGRKSAVSSVASSPNGAFILTGSWDGTAKLWNPEDATTNPRDKENVKAFKTFGTPSIRSGAEGRLKRITSVAVSLDSRYILTGAINGLAKLWDIEKTEAIRIFGNEIDAVPEGRQTMS